MPLLPGETLDPKRVRQHRLASLAHQLGLPGYRDDFVHAALAAELWKQGLHEVLHAFDSAEIPTCRLKGSAYFLVLYNDPAERLMGDLDLLVPPERFGEATNILCRLGFAARTNKDFVFAPSHHALTFDRGPLTVDLHRNMMQERRSSIDLVGIWQRADLSNHRPHALDEIVLHICHMIRSELMVPLATFVDLALLLRQPGIKRSDVLARCDSFRVGRGARVVLAMHDLLATGKGGRAVPYPLPSADELVCMPQLPRLRQLLSKVLLVDGPRELAGLAVTTFGERVRRWR